MLILYFNTIQLRYLDIVSPDWTFIDGGVFGLTEKKIELVHLQAAC